MPRACRVGGPISSARFTPGLRTELLRPPDVDVGRVQVVLAVHVELVHAPEPAGDRAERSPRGVLLQAAVQVVLRELLRLARRGPQELVVGHQQRVRQRRVRPRVEELAVLVEHLDAVVRAIADVDAALLVGHDGVHRVHVVRARLVGRRAAHAPRRDVLAVPIELDDARVRVAVADEEGAVGQPRDVGRPREVRLVVAGHAARADRLHQRLAVARELEERVRAVIDEPDVAIRVVRVHQHAVRTDEQLVVLLPRLDQPAVAVDDVDDVIPARMAGGILLRQVIARRVARRHGIAGLLEHRETAAREDDHAIGALGPDARRRSDLEARAAPVLRPARRPARTDR